MSLSLGLRECTLSLEKDSSYILLTNYFEWVPIVATYGPHLVHQYGGSGEPGSAHFCFWGWPQHDKQNVIDMEFGQVEVTMADIDMWWVKLRKFAWRSWLNKWSNEPRFSFGWVPVFVPEASFWCPIYNCCMLCTTTLRHYGCLDSCSMCNISKFRCCCEVGFADNDPITLCL